MPILVTVTISQKVVTSRGLSKDDAAAFHEFVPSGRLEFTEAEYTAPKILPKEKKELETFCAFARSEPFKPTIRRLIGAEPGNTLEIEILSSAKGEDPPDIILKVGSCRLGIEVTDFPPDGTAFAAAIAEVKGPAPLPTFHEGACSPEVIKRFMATPVSLVKPHFASAELEATALHSCAKDVIEKKDATGKSGLLLLAAPFAFSWPTDEVIASVLATTALKNIRAVVLVLSNESHVHWVKCI